MFVDKERLAEMEILRPSGCCCELSAVQAFNARAARNARMMKMFLWIAGSLAIMALLAIGFSA